LENNNAPNFLQRSSHDRFPNPHSENFGFTSLSLFRFEHLRALIWRHAEVFIGLDFLPFPGLLSQLKQMHEKTFLFPLIVAVHVLLSLKCARNNFLI